MQVCSLILLYTHSFIQKKQLLSRVSFQKAFQQVTNEAGWWFENVLFCHRLRRIIPTDFHIFQKGRYTTNQEACGFPPGAKRFGRVLR